MRRIDPTLDLRSPIVVFADAPTRRPWRRGPGRFMPGLSSTHGLATTSAMSRRRGRTSKPGETDSRCGCIAIWRDLGELLGSKHAGSTPPPCSELYAFEQEDSGLNDTTTA